jgi:L-iditol 2-dehydrogenase
LKVAYLTGIEQVEIRDAPDPGIKNPTDVRLQVETVGVCGSDMHYYRTGRIGDQVVKFPFPVGHELSASVLEVGSDVEDLAVGERVAVDPLVCCGKCDQCTSARPHTCRDQGFLGVPGQLDGALCEQIVMPARCCYKLPDGVTLVQGALIEPFSIGLYAQRLAGDVAGKTIAVLGCGPIGLSVLTALKAAGPANVYMTDIRDNRAELAGRMGAEWTGDPQRQDIVAEICRSEPTGLDLAYECAGERDTADQCLQLVKPGGTVLIVGIPELDRLSFDMNIMRRCEVRIQNVRRQNECFAPAIDLIAWEKVDLGAMVTHEFPLSETSAAFDIVANYKDNVVKAMIHVR